MVIPELIRLMTENYGIEFEEAYSIVQKMTGYTNHTILAEALEKWPLEFLEEVVPHLVTPISSFKYAANGLLENSNQRLNVIPLVLLLNFSGYSS